MTRRRGLFFQLLTAFALYAAGLAIALGGAAYFAASRLGLDLFEKHAAILCNTLIHAEKQARGNEDSLFESARIIAPLGLTFLVGKQLPAKWQALPDGFHLESGERFVFIRREQGVPYTLAGPLQSRDEFFAAIGVVFAICGLTGICAAVFLAIYLARRAARPVQALTEALEHSGGPEAAILPPEYAQRNDETGFLAARIRRYQQDAQERIAQEKFFAGAVSHELRTPLTVIVQGVELLELQCQNNAGALIALKRLGRTAASMASVLGALLALARSENRPRVDIDLEIICREVIAGLLPGHQEEPATGNMLRILPIDAGSALQITSDFPLDESALALGDPVLVATAIRNLLENAIRHRGAADVYLHFGTDYLEIRNRVEFVNQPGDGGLGLLIAARACARMGWKLEQFGDRAETIFRMIFNRGETSGRDRQAA